MTLDYKKSQLEEVHSQLPLFTDEEAEGMKWGDLLRSHEDGTQVGLPFRASVLPPFLLMIVWVRKIINHH